MDKSYKQEVLETADADGQLCPPPVRDWFAGQSVLMGMYMQGLIEKRGEGAMYHRGGPWFITDKGRAAASIGKERTNP